MKSKELEYFSIVNFFSTKLSFSILKFKIMKKNSLYLHTNHLLLTVIKKYFEVRGEIWLVVRKRQHVLYLSPYLLLLFYYFCYYNRLYYRTDLLKL